MYYQYMKIPRTKPFIWLAAVFMLAILICTCHQYPDVWRPGPEPIYARFCPGATGVKPTVRKAILAAVLMLKRISERNSSPIHSINTSTWTVYSKYGCDPRGVVISWTVKILENGDAIIATTKGSPEHTGAIVEYVDLVGHSIKKGFESHTCRNTPWLEKKADIALPKENELRRQASPVLDQAQDGRVPSLQAPMEKAEAAEALRDVADASVQDPKDASY